MSDAPFDSGRGAIRGRLASSTGPVAGARVMVTGTGIESTSAGDGSFQIADVPAGRRELVAIDEGQCLSAMASVRVAGGATSDAGELLLKAGANLLAMVTDPDLPIEGTLVGLEELPLLETTSDLKGEAAFSCLPAGGCFGVKVNWSPLPFAFETRKICLDAAENRLSLTPEDTYGLKTAQALSALRQTALLLRPLEACISSCRVPDWWDNSGGPPCPMAIGNLNNEISLRNMIFYIRNSNRLSISETGILGCRPEISPAVCRDNKCVFIHSENVTQIIWQGAGQYNCSEKTLSLLDSDEEISYLSGCLGIDDPRPGGALVLIRHYLDLEIVRAAWTGNPDEGVVIFLDAVFKASTSLVPLDRPIYVLLRLENPPTPLSSERISAFIDRVAIP